MKILLDTLFDLLGVSKADNTRTRASVNRLIELMKSANTMTMERVSSNGTSRKSLLKNSGGIFVVFDNVITVEIDHLSYFIPRNTIIHTYKQGTCFAKSTYGAKSGPVRDPNIH